MEKEKYIVVVEAYDKQLVKMVNEKIKDGYEPYGNVVISFNETGIIKSFVQIMMLKDRK
jgi:rRNA pseudouridine-1189 N-methylase Emg1 (Nep1/Mra1 family)